MTCDWKQDKKLGCWYTNCGHSPLYDDDPKMNDWTCYCGKHINLLGKRKRQSLLTFNK